MYCPKCGKKQIDNAKYCYSCGSIIILPIQDDDSLPDHKNTNLKKSNESLIEVTKNSFDYNGDKEINIDSLFDVEDLSISELVTCPICGKRKVARSAVSCPECGYGISEHFEKVKREQEERQSIEDLQKSRNTKIGCGFILFIFILIIVLYTITSSGGQFTSSKATCKMCGRSWNSGDSGGNYMSIALSGMCKSCESNYKWSQSALGN